MTQELRYLASEISYYYRKYGTINMADFYTYLTDKEELLVVYNFITNLDYENEVSVKAIEDYIVVYAKIIIKIELQKICVQNSYTTSQPFSFRILNSHPQYC